MKNALFIVTILFAAIMSTACINNFAVQELNNKAQEYLSKGDYDAAIGRLEASLDIDPTIFETNYNLGVAYINAEKYDDAVEVLENAASINPNQPEVYYSLAVAQYNSAEDILAGKTEDDEDKAEKVLSEAETTNAAAPKEVTPDDKIKAAKLYVDALRSIEKYLSFDDLSQDSKVAAQVQLSSIQEKLVKLKPQLPQADKKQNPAPIPSKEG